MKRCPECRRDYADDTLLYCLEDGVALVQGSVPSPDEPQTAILHSTDTSGEAPTRAQIHTTAAEPQGSVGIRSGGFDKRLLLAPVALAVIAVGGYFGYRYLGSSTTGQIDSIAVMPFVNESGNEDVEYLSDGMTETLINSLTEIPDLSVKARSTVFYYKGKNTTAKQIGDELKVEAVLLGRIVQRGENLKLSLELVDTESLNAVWSETYDRNMSDLVSLQSEVARTVSDKLRAKLTSAEQQQVTKTYTTSSEAQQLYLKGRFHWNKRIIEDFEKAEQYFQQAIERDPNYALAYTGLADTYGLIPQYGNVRPRDYYPRAKLAAQKALELDDELAEAHNSLANILQTFEYDLVNAEREYRRAIELNPNYASAHHWYGEFLAIKGDHDRAVAEVEIALKLDPFSRVINRGLGYVLYAAGKYDESIVQLKRSTELFPDDPWGYVFLGDAYAAKGNYDLAVTGFLTHLRLEGKSSEAIRKYEEAYQKDGWKGFWLAQLDDQLAEKAASLQNNRSYVRNWRIAQMYATVGNKDKAIEYLEAAIEEHEPDVIYVPMSHYYDWMKEDSRFVELLRRIGAPVK